MPVDLSEMLCTAGLPAAYTQILTAYQLTRRQCYDYLPVYIIVHMLDDSITLVIAVHTLGRL